MLRQTVRGVLALVLVAAVLDSAGRGQPPAARDRVYYHDKKDGTVRNTEGELRPTPAGYQVFSTVENKVVATVSAADVVRVVPGDAPAGFDRAAVTDPVKAEEARNWEAAKKAHDESLKKATGAPAKFRRYLEFRQAIAAAHVADDAADDATARAKAEEAVKLLSQFLVAYKSGWEVWAAAQAEARLRVGLTERKTDGGKEAERRTFEEAARTWGRVARSADLTTDLKLAAALEQIDLLVRAGKYGEATQLIADAGKTAPAGAVADRLKVYGLAAKFAETKSLAGVKPIEDEIARTKDVAVRAAGYGMLGELYLAADKPREAMWAFLWVEVVYNQDPDEVIKALVRLADAFHAQGDEDRAQAYREKVRRYRGGL